MDFCHELSIANRGKKILDEVREVMRLHHYSIHTERSYQNQAMNALVFLYKKVLHRPLDQKINAVRADRKVNVPVVLTRNEVSRVIAIMGGVPPWIVKLLYGSGLRIMEAVRLRIKDVDFAMKQVTSAPARATKTASRPSAPL
jgi:integrase